MTQRPPDLRPFASLACLLLPAVVFATGLADCSPDLDPPVAVISFHPALSYALSGYEPKDIVAGDFDGDEILDLAITTHEGEGHLTVLRGDGRGGFAQTAVPPIPAKAWGLLASDFNVDGGTDLALTEGDAASTAVPVYLGNGTGVLSLTTTLSAGRCPIALAGGDFDGDGQADLAVASFGNGVSSFMGHGDGSFGSPHHVPGLAELAATDIASADLDRDGRLDLAVSHLDGIHILRGSGGGEFARVNTTGGSGIVEALAAGDLSSDGTADLASVDAYGNRLLVNLGDGAGGFSPAAAYAGGGRPVDVAIADLNRDCAADVIIANEDSGSIWVYRGLGDGTLLAPLSFPTGYQPAALAVGDWDKDGYLDVAAPYRNLGETPFVSVLRQQVLSSPATPDVDIAGHAWGVHLAWSHVMFDTTGQQVAVSHFEIRRGSRAYGDPCDAVLLATVPDDGLTPLTFDDTDAYAAEMYFYHIRAVTEAGNIGLSAHPVGVFTFALAD